jgi:thiol-disulfide isomerase/thioredoxin
MKKFIALLAAFGLISCTAQTGKEISAEAKAEKMTTLDGKTTTFGEVLEAHKGKPVLIEIWASWCGDCVKAMPKFKETQSQFPDIDYVLISMDKTDEKWKQGIEKHELKGDHYWVPGGMKGSFGKSINLDWIPRYMIVDAEGKTVTFRAIETDFDAINTTLKSLSK